MPLTVPTTCYIITAKYFGIATVIKLYNCRYLSLIHISRKHVQRVTAAQASGINDGAAAIVLASGEAVAKYGLKPMAKLVSWGQGGVDPKIMGVGPVPASRQAMAKAGLKIEDMDLVEANESFAAQSIACLLYTSRCV